MAVPSNKQNRTTQTQTRRGPHPTNGIKLQPYVPPAQEFTPADIAGLGLWLDATQLQLNDGDPVTSWPDLSTSKLITAPISAPPIYDLAGINGHPAVKFNGTDTTAQTMLVTGWGASLSGKAEYTVLFVHERATGDTDVYPIILSAPGDSSWLWLAEYETPAMLWGQGPAYRTYNAALTSGVPWLLSFHFMPGDPHFYANSVEVLYASDNGMVMTVPDVGNNAIIGGYSNMQYGLDGCIGEVIYYDHAITSDELTQVHDYLMAKWGLTTTQIHQPSAPGDTGPLPPHLEEGRGE
jgi:hypothetical protein